MNLGTVAIAQNHPPPECQSVPGALNDGLQDTSGQDSYIICGVTVQKPRATCPRISSTLAGALHQEQGPPGGRALCVCTDTCPWGQL